MAQAPRKTGGTRSRNRADDAADDKPAGRRTTRGKELEPAKGRAVGGSLAKQMEQQAEAAANMEKGAPMGRNFSFKGGQMVFDGAPVKDNEVVVIIAGAVIAKAYYEGRYDPDNPEPPVCYAFDTDQDNLAPIPEDVLDLQNNVCSSCPHNVFGSSDVGKGKSCKDSRRLALLPAGTIQRNGDIDLVENAGELAKAEFGFAMLPPTSLTPYATFVRQVANTMKRPPHGVYAVMKCTPDAKKQFVISWEVIDVIEDEKVLQVVMDRHEEAQKALIQPYTYPAEDEAPKRGSARGGGRNQSARSNKSAGDDKPKVRSRTGGASGGRAAGGQRIRKY